GQRLIVTVARIGYRFTAAVEHVDSTAASSDARVQPGPEHGPTVEQGRLVVGRERELALLRRALERARAGHGGILAIAGAPGRGKTAAVEKFLREVRARAPIGRGRCPERLAGADPPLPFLEALDEVPAGTPPLLASLCRLAPPWSQHVAPA